MKIGVLTAALQELTRIVETEFVDTIVDCQKLPEIDLNLDGLSARRNKFRGGLC